jgi:hypothetical protein
VKEGTLSQLSASHKYGCYLGTQQMELDLVMEAERKTEAGAESRGTQDDTGRPILTESC